MCHCKLVLPVDIFNMARALIKKECEQALWLVCHLRIGKYWVTESRKDPLFPQKKISSSVQAPREKWEICSLTWTPLQKRMN